MTSYCIWLKSRILFSRPLQTCTWGIIGLNSHCSKTLVSLIFGLPFIHPLVWLAAPLRQKISWDQSFLPSDLCNKPFKGVWWGLGTSPSFTVKLKMRTLSNYEATFLQSVHIKNVPCPSARDRQIHLRLQSLVQEQVQAKLLKSAQTAMEQSHTCTHTDSHFHIFQHT